MNHARGSLRTVPYARPADGSPYYFVAKDLGLSTRRGPVFSGVNCSVKPGEVVALRGHSGSGKTALLLTIAGHMAFNQGDATFGGHDLKREHNLAQRSTGMALFDGLNNLQGSLRVIGVLGAEFELYGRPPKRDVLMKYLSDWDLADVADLRAKDLTSKKLLRFGMALACVGHPPMIVVDDIEDELTKSQSEDLMRTLIDQCRMRGMIAFVGVVERDLAAMADQVIFLEREEA